MELLYIVFPRIKYTSNRNHGSDDLEPLGELVTLLSYFPFFLSYLIYIFFFKKKE